MIRLVLVTITALAIGHTIVKAMNNHIHHQLEVKNNEY